MTYQVTSNQSRLLRRCHPPVHRILCSHPIRLFLRWRVLCGGSDFDEDEEDDEEEDYSEEEDEEEGKSWDELEKEAMR